MLAAALALVLGMLPPAETAGELTAEEAALRGTSIVLTDFKGGGMGRPNPTRTVSFGYDWNRACYRAVEHRFDTSGGAWMRVYRAQDLGTDRYRKLVERVLKLGLLALPLEEPAGVVDLYGGENGIRFFHADHVWDYRPAAGCSCGPPAVPATPQQIATFHAVVDLLEGVLASGPMLPASALDQLSTRDRKEREVRAMARAFDRLLSRGQTGEGNWNAATMHDFPPEPLCIRMPYRDTLPARSDYGNTHASEAWLDVQFAADGKRIASVFEAADRSRAEANRARRVEFVDAHPELSGPRRDLIRAGWVGSGMSEAMVRAALGDPDERRDDAGTIVLEYRRGSGSPEFAGTLRIGERGLYLPL